jgi:type II secretory ATPase GspE/PulE/Tfp pilus assembly ATPase PilB-like protein
MATRRKGDDHSTADDPSSGMTGLAGVTRQSDVLSADYLEYAGVLPLEREADRVRIATWRDAIYVLVLDDLRFHFDADLVVGQHDEHEVRAAIKRIYASDSTAQGLIDAFTPTAGGEESDFAAIDDLVALANEAPVVKLVNLLLVEALDARASDVHLESQGDLLEVRYRIDGVLQSAPSPPRHLASAIVSRLKIMSELDIAERRLPQDGRIRLKLQDRQVDVRISTIPTLHGESVVLRLLEKSRRRITLEKLGMSGGMLARFRAAIRQSHGIVLVTGPTGSGKTTTLYAAIDLIRTGREKIVTVEDPIEYELGVPQVPVHDKIGVTFATALRAILRQDPDVLLVGEIRDAETAEVATQAALTGHLVLSTLHTNDAPTALTRLLDLGVAPYLVASTVRAVLAQRLVRVICDRCKTPATADPGTLRELGSQAEEMTTWLGAGCAHCRGTGYHERIGMYELLTMTDPMREAVAARATAAEIRRIMSSDGAPTLRADGFRLVLAGITTPIEVLRAATV